MLRTSTGTRQPAVTLAACALALSACASAERSTGPAVLGARDVSIAALPDVRVSELHYDNAGTDAGEAIELSAPGGTSLEGWSVVLYNGNGGAPYNTRPLTGTVPATCGARGVVVLTYPTNGIQNGDPDGLALVNAGGQVVEFLSYGGTFAAVGGPADGQTATDIGARESGTTPVGASLARTAADTWNPPAPNSFGACNDDGEPPAPAGPLDRLTATPPSAAVAANATVTLSAVAEDAAGASIAAGTITWTDNDSPNVTVTPSADGRTAVVRGDVAGGPVQVVASLTLDGVTRADTVPVTVTGALPPGGTTRLRFSGFNRAPLPPGFEDQLFAQAFSGPSNADSIPGMRITWRALTPEFGLIDSVGVVRGVGDGRALFEARTTDDFRDTAFVDVATPQDPTSAVYANHLEFGRPTDATPADEQLVTWPEFAASYNRTRGQSNWIAYNLEATHRGPAERCDCFTPDPSLPADVPVLSTNDYTGSGYSRGHMTMSEDRTTGPNAPQTSVDNARTFLFSNIVPQSAANNGGPWLDLEIELGDRAARGDREIFIYAGGAAYEGSLKNEGRVAIPTRTWKIAVLLDRDRGAGDVRTAGDVEVIAIVTPNTLAEEPLVRGRAWEDFRVSVDSVEALTGYDFLSALPDDVERTVEAQRSGVRALQMDVKPERINPRANGAVNVALLSGASFDATAVNAADVRLVVNGRTAVAPIARAGTVNSAVADVNGDGRLDRVIGFGTSALRAAGFGAGASSLVLRPAGAAPAWEAVDPTPPTVVR